MPPKTKTPPPQPVGPHEIAQLLGVSKQRFGQLVTADHFPAPWRELKAGRVWRDSDIVAWARARGRSLPGDPPEVSAGNAGQD